MMKFKQLLILLAVLMLVALNSQPSQATQFATAVSQLVYMARPTNAPVPLPEDGLTIVAYTHGDQANGRSQSALIAIANANALAELSTANLAYQTLETIPPNATYYLVTQMPDQPAPTWGAATVLLAESDWWLIRAAEATAVQLAEQGLALQRITFDPKPDLWQTAVTTPSAPTVIEPDPIIENMINQITSSNLARFVGNLSGETSVIVGGSPYTIVSRHTYSGTPIQKATQYVGEYFTAHGLAVEYHQWSGSTYPNVIAEIPGQVNPDEIYILSAHLDNMPIGPIARGADDNASGVVAAMLAANLFSDYDWGCTIRFGIWTGEEQGLNGSAAYALRAFNRGEEIAGVLNLDMIAWNTTDSSPDIDLHSSNSVPGSYAIAQTFVDVIDAYNLDLIPTISPNGSGASDHASFWNYGYPAIMAIEDFSDFNPYYHTVNDRLSILNLDYFTEFTRANIATFAHLSGCLLSEQVGAIDGYITAVPGGDPIANASVLLQAPGQDDITAVTDPTGYYTQTLPANTYTVTVSATGYQPAVVTGVVVTSAATTTLNLALDGACEPVTAVTLTPFPAPPFYAGDAITVTLTVLPEAAPFTYTLALNETPIATGHSAGPPVSHPLLFPTVGDYNLTATAWNCDPATAVADALDFTILPATDRFRIYLPVVSLDSPTTALRPGDITLAFEGQLTLLLH
jgi:Zn-dependent M28 family amino/carboxypeptidase